jgi:hypothetical protein
MQCVRPAHLRDRTTPADIAQTNSPDPIKLMVAHGQLYGARLSLDGLLRARKEQRSRLRAHRV